MIKRNLFIYLWLFLFLSNVYSKQIIEKDTIIDCHYSKKETIINSNAPKYIKDQLSLLNVYYYSFDDKIHKGQIIINRNLVKDVKEIFNYILKVKYPVKKVIPINYYNWNDSISMQDNNSSGFNYRSVKNRRAISKHALGKAIDINPFLNPVILGNKFYPSNSTYNIKDKGVLNAKHKVVLFIKNLGWSWGGDWKKFKDYQHFEKQ